ncbi:MAG: hypothetical protein AB9869_17925 [Verrucomicrobiia bacterium]
MVSGYKISALDMEACRLQKDYLDAISQSVKELETLTETGLRSQIRHRDRIGQTSFERLTQAMVAWMVPQRLRPSAKAFASKWRGIAEDKTRSKDEKLADLADLLNDEYFEEALIGHIESFTNPSYAADMKSPFQAEYIRIHARHDNTGKTISSLDDLVDELFESQEGEVEDILSPEGIREKVINEIGRAVKLYTAETKRAQYLVDPDKSQVKLVTAENFMNRPRGKRVLPRGFYTYTCGFDEEQKSIQFQVLAIYAQRYLNSLQDLLNTLQTEMAGFKKDVEEGKTTAKETVQAQQRGESRLSYIETEQLIALVTRALQDFEAFVTSKAAQEPEIYSWAGQGRSFIANSVLQKAGTMLQNYMGPMFQMARLDLTMLRSAQSIFIRAPLAGEVIASTRAIVTAGKATVDALAGILAELPQVNARAKAVLDELAAHPGAWNAWAGGIANYLLHQKARLDHLKQIGVIQSDPAMENLRSYTKLFVEGGRVSRRKSPSVVRRVNNVLKSAVALMNETGIIAPEWLLGIPAVQFPRFMGSQLVDSVNNTFSSTATNRMLNTLVESSAGAFANLDASTLDRFTRVLSAEEVFGRKGASERDLAELRLLLGKAGVNLDRMLIDFWTRKQAGAEKPLILRPEQMNSLLIEVAKYLNKGMFSNRPFSPKALGRFGYLFLGYGINLSALMAKSFARHTRDSRNRLLKAGDTALDTALLLFLVALFGQAFAPLASLLHRWLYREERPIKPITKAASVGEAVRILSQNGVNFMPLVGRLFLNAVGAAAPGSPMSMYGFQLLPVSLSNSFMQAMSRSFQTGDWHRPWMEFSRQWIPNARIILNRIPGREGITTEAALRNTLVANAPTGVEVQQFQRGTVRRFSPATAQVDNVINALSRTGGPDMETVRAERQRGIERLIEAGRTPEEAEKSFDRAVLARNPYVATYGRELTGAEMAELESSLSPEQLQYKRTVESGRQAYAQEFGLNEPDFTRAEPGAGRASAPSIPAPLRRRTGVRRAGTRPGASTGRPIAPSRVSTPRIGIRRRTTLGRPAPRVRGWRGPRRSRPAVRARLPYRSIRVRRSRR